MIDFHTFISLSLGGIFVDAILVFNVFADIYNHYQLKTSTGQSRLMVFGLIILPCLIFRNKLKYQLPCP